MLTAGSHSASPPASLPTGETHHSEERNTSERNDTDMRDVNESGEENRETHAPPPASLPQGIHARQPKRATVADIVSQNTLSLRHDETYTRFLHMARASRRVTPSPRSYSHATHTCGFHDHWVTTAPQRIRSLLRLTYESHCLLRITACRVRPSAPGPAIAAAPARARRAVLAHQRRFGDEGRSRASPLR